MPAVRRVEIKYSIDDVAQALRAQPRIILDDGTPTDLSAKGDGIQSLAVVSLLHRSSLASRRGGLTLCLEEPEAHLHPRAIHQLGAVLKEISANQQVIITTHSPLLENRDAIGSNIIVKGSKGRSAESIAEIRDVLGVKVSDNLAGAQVVLVVEGDSDVRSLGALLRLESQDLANAMADGVLAIEHLAGASNLSYKLYQLQGSIVRWHVFLDDDQAGTAAAEKARDLDLLGQADQTFTTVPGRAESELEDLYTVDAYSKMVVDRWNVVLDGGFTRSRSKWSRRMKEAFARSGQVWNDRVEREVKNAVTLLVEDRPADILHADLRGSFDALVRALEKKLSDIQTG